jgi:hypothetical protein
VRATIDAWNDRRDVYRVRLVRGQRLFVILHGGRTVDCRLALWRPGTRSLGELGKRVVQSSRASSAQAIRGYHAKVTGWYDVEVKASAKSPGPYVLRYRKSS